MAYQVLARKWRPNRFSELVGQEHVVTAISNALDNDRLHHAYLFTGTRGVGKTTIARIFSKSLNCEAGMSANPCGECPTCKEIENGSYVDLLEIDAASRTKVEDTRELLDNVQYKPTRGQFKVYLIDEVHMLSKHSFNALLKTLEEPPPHVKFLLATTDPQKLPVTILSRCLQFNLKALSREQIGEQLKHVLSAENIAFESGALNQLARAAQGSMRDALSLTDQAIAQGNGNVSNEIVTDMLGLMDKTQVIKIVHLVFNTQAQEVMAQIELLAQQAVNFEQVLNEIMSLLHQVALTQLVPEACKLETVSAKAIFHLAKNVRPEHVQLCYQIALEGKKDIAYAADARTGIEMTLMRMMAFNPAPSDHTMPEINQLSKSASNSHSADEQHKASSSHSADEQYVASAEQSNVPVDAGLSDGAPPDDLVQQQDEIIQQAEQFRSHNSPPQAYSNSEYENPPEQLTTSTEHGASSPSSNPVAEAPDAPFISQPAAEDAAESVVPANPELPAKASSATVSATQSLIDLKNKLAQKEIASEVADPKEKKSESTVSLLRPTANPTAPAPFKADQAKNDSAQQQPATAAPVNPQTHSAKQGSNATTDTPAQPNQQQIASADQSVPHPLSASKPTSPTSITPQEVAHTAPPWHSHEQLQALDLADNQGQEPSPVQTTTGPNESSSSPEPAFDPQAHLDDKIEVEVDFDIPVFMPAGEKVVASQQLDTWSQLIEKMQLTALTKQLALHSSYQKNDQQVTLKLLNSKPHLDTESARSQLQHALSQLFEQQIELHIEHGTPINTPFAVQQTINQVRLEHAWHVAENDENIQRIKSAFNAHVVNDSLKPR